MASNGSSPGWYRQGAGGSVGGGSAAWFPMGTEVSLRESPARTGFQVALEAQRLSLGRECDDDHQRPRAVFDGVAGRTMVVPLQAIVDVARQANVMALGFDVAPKDVDETLADPTHASAGCKAGADSRKRAGAGDD